jgi:hypothetical protein
MDNDAKTVKPVSGTAEIDVNDLTNTGTFEARLKIPEAISCWPSTGSTSSALPERRHRRVPARARTDSGCGDNNWPKTFVTSPAGDSDMPR